ncbi:MAG: DUF523 domain-containing protein [Clostridium butyricum]|nr:DUF523 domain-containing protein [Clostridium butyricum]
MYLVSACLCGVNCKYSGKNNLNKTCLRLLREGKAILICPEQLGGLTTPRNPAELNSSAEEVINGNGEVIDNKGNNLTEPFVKGAYEALNIAKETGITKAILKEGSPSCGCNTVYDGTFSGNKILGKGLTAYLFEQEGITVFSDEDIQMSNDKLVYLDKFDREKAKKRKLFRLSEEDEDYGCTEYFDLTENLQDMSDMPKRVEKNVKRLMISLARDLMGFEQVDEIAEATGLPLDEVQKIIDEEYED